MDQTYDKMFFPEGDYIGGLDEVGVSDLAGPLVAACVILPIIDPRQHDLRIFEVNDSKQIPEKYRKQHAEAIWTTAYAIGVGEVTPAEVDYLGHYNARRVAMLRAVAGCKKRSSKPVVPDFLLVDGKMSLPVSIRYKAIEKADTKSLCVAAASVIAKVHRDAIMIKLHDQYPHYDWVSNKGYPCEQHFEGLDTHGIQFGIHRLKSWPFVDRYGDKSGAWIERRRLWRKVTKDTLHKNLGEYICSIKKASSNA